MPRTSLMTFIFDAPAFFKTTSNSDFSSAAAPPASPAGPAIITAPPAAGGGEAAAEKTEFDVILSSAGAGKLKVVKELKGLLGLGLKEAKELVEAGGKIKEGIDKAEAEEIKGKLEAAGAEVELA